MRVPLSWLRDYVDVDLDPEALAERLTLLGMEVKSIERWGAAWRSVVVGELLTVDRHPRADRLSLTTVTVGPGEPLHIVCGATNIAPGQRVPVALPGGRPFLGACSIHPEAAWPRRNFTPWGPDLQAAPATQGERTR